MSGEKVWMWIAGLLAASLVAVISWTAQRDIGRVDAALLATAGWQDSSEQEHQETRAIIAQQAETDAKFTTLIADMRRDVDRLENHVLDGGRSR